MANIVDQTNLVDKSINLLQDIDTTTLAPVTGDILKFDGSNWFTDKETDLIPTNRETLSVDKAMVIGDAVRQYLDPGGEDRYVTLPDPAIAGMYYIIKNLDGGEDGILTIRETLTGPNVLTLADATGILESYFIYDGTEWHAQGPGTVILPNNIIGGFATIDEITVVMPSPLPLTGGFATVDETTVVMPAPLGITGGFATINEATVVSP